MLAHLHIVLCLHWHFKRVMVFTEASPLRAHYQILWTAVGLTTAQKVLGDPACQPSACCTTLAKHAIEHCSMVMQTQWQVEREALWKAVRLEVMQEILEDPAYQMVRISLSKPSHASHVMHCALVAGPARSEWVTYCKYSLMW